MLEQASRKPAFLRLMTEIEELALLAERLHLRVRLLPVLFAV
jgi:hypothetical protein